MKKPTQALILLLFILFFGTITHSEVTAEKCQQDPDCVKFYSELGNKNFEILREIRDHYVEEIGFEKLMDAFRKSGINQVFSLLDPHSEYITTPQIDKKEEAHQPFGGVGIEMMKINGKIVIIGLVKDKPAMKSEKIRKGDIILAVGNKSVEGIPKNTVSEWIRGEVGQEVILKFFRQGPPSIEFTVALTRELIEVNSLTSKIIGNVGYIKPREFEAGVSDKIREKNSDFPPNIIGLILDLRRNPGGSLKEALRVSAIFLERKQYIGKVIQRKRVEQFFAAGSRPEESERISLPLVVLVDALSASASEIVASALQDNRRAIIVGMPTFGKALSQTTYGYYEIDEYWKEILQGDYFMLTTGRIYRPNGLTLQGKGVIPDIIISDGEGEDIEKIMSQPVISERVLMGHLKGEAESTLTSDEKNQLNLLKEDRQLYVALQILKILSEKRGL